MHVCGWTSGGVAAAAAEAREAAPHVLSVWSGVGYGHEYATLASRKEGTKETGDKLLLSRQSDDTQREREKEKKREDLPAISGDQARQ